MPRYMLIYHGAPTDPTAMSEDDRNAEMQRWMEWGGRVGEDLIDFGSPFATSTSVVDDGSETTAVPLSGYTIVQARDLEGAKAHVKGHPYLSEGHGDFAVELYELVDMPAGDA